MCPPSPTFPPSPHSRTKYAPFLLPTQWSPSESQYAEVKELSFNFYCNMLPILFPTPIGMFRWYWSESDNCGLASRVYPIVDINKSKEATTEPFSPTTFVRNFIIVLTDVLRDDEHEAASVASPTGVIFSLFPRTVSRLHALFPKANYHFYYSDIHSTHSRRRFWFVGYQGKSEPGVIALRWLSLT